MAGSACSRSMAGRDIAAINITPLVDVMLVLLIIFMVAAPVLTRPVPLDLPQPGPHPPAVQTIHLRIAPSGDVLWNGAPQPLAALQGMLEVEVQRHAGGRPPLLQIDASGEAAYGVVTRVLAAARNAGLDRIAIAQP